MASCTCSFLSLVDQCLPCGTSSDYPTHVEVVTVRDCSRDILGHWNRTESVVINHSELKLLLAQAGILFTFSIVLHCFIKLCNGLSSWSTSIMLQILFAFKARFFKLDRGMHCIDQGLNK